MSARSSQSDNTHIEAIVRVQICLWCFHVPALVIRSCGSLRPRFQGPRVVHRPVIHQRCCSLFLCPLPSYIRSDSLCSFRGVLPEPIFPQAFTVFGHANRWCQCVHVHRHKRCSCGARCSSRRVPILRGGKVRHDRSTQRFVPLVARKSQLNSDTRRSDVEKDPTPDCVVQEVAGQDLPALPEVSPLVQGLPRLERTPLAPSTSGLQTSTPLPRCNFCKSTGSPCTPSARRASSARFLWRLR